MSTMQNTTANELEKIMFRIAPVVPTNTDTKVAATPSQVKASLGKIPNTLGNVFRRNTLHVPRSSPMKIGFFQSSSLAIAVALIAAWGYASAQSSTGDLQLVGANATLVQDISSKSASQGDAVTAKLTSTVKGATELPKGTVLLGKVDEVQASTNRSPAKLSIVFDRAHLRDGHEIPIKATLLGAYPELDGYVGYDQNSDEPLLPQSIPVDEKVDQEPGALHNNVAMHSAAKEDVSAVFTSTDHNIDLKKGTQLQVAIAPEGGSQGTALGQ
jgi:hypothetical protein